MIMDLTRRDLLSSLAVAAPAMAVAQTAASPSLNVEAGVDRIVVRDGKTWLRGWAGYGHRPRARDPWEKQPAQPPPPDSNTKFEWSKQSGPGQVTFENAHALITTASFSRTGEYTLKLVADDSRSKPSSTLQVSVEQPPPAQQLGAEVVQGLEDTDYGSRGFTIRDAEGNLWSFGTYAG